MPTTLPFAILCTALALASHPAAQGTEDSSDEAKIQRLFSAWDRTGSPGCAVAIVRDGRTVYARGFGMANLEHGAPITTTTVFDAGSMAKQFTAMCVALLVEQKKLSFDDDIHVYIPELPRYGQPIAVRDLIHHTSGLREQHDLLRWAGWRWEDPVSEADILDLVTKQRSLNFTPGEEFLYSNTNYLLLAVIVKRVAGVSLKEFATERVFKPLAMTSTRFADDHDAILPGRATGHIANGAGFSIFNPAFDFVGPTSLYTTVEDLARWDANFYEPRVGTPETIALVRTPGRLAGGQPLDYAFGLEIGAYRGLRVESPDSAPSCTASRTNGSR